MTDARVEARIVINHQGELRFVEDETDLASRSANVGLCFSGGGTRALTSALGALRGLSALGLMGRVRYISSVSGGSWASVPYTFYRSGARDDDELLGLPIPPEDLTMEGLEAELPPGSLGATATQSLLDRLKFYLKDEAQDVVWCRAVGDVYLAPFGLYDPDKANTFTLDDASREAFLARGDNAAALADIDIIVARPGRPYLIINATVLSPADVSALSQLDPIPFSFTPLYCGTPASMDATFTPRRGDPVVERLGGGYVETPASGGEAPEAVNEGHQSLPLPAPGMSLDFAAGTSSAALAGFFELIPGIDDNQALAPIRPLWPIEEGAEPKTTRYNFGDGGVLENYGIVPLLLRKVETIVVFVNTSTELNLDYDPCDPPENSDLDTYLPPLFGYPIESIGTSTEHNQIFPKEDFAGVVAGLQAARREGRTVMTTTTHTVLDNAYFGLQGGWEVKVCWMYLERVPEWEARLSDTKISKNIERGTRAYFTGGPLEHFPHYKTAGQNGLELVRLTAEQVRLLAQLSCWNITSNADLFRNLLGG